MSGTVDEESSLLPPQSPRPAKFIPFSQFTLLLILQLAEPFTVNIIAPFAPQLIRDIGITQGNEARVGLYVGLMHSLFFLSEAVTVLHWSRLSDHIGRKPVILQGLFGLSLSMYFFGLSRTFFGLVLSRMLNGALNGNVGVMKSMMMEMSDSTNVAQIYTTLPIAWATGSSIGPLIGGFLSHPADQFPAVFGKSEFLKIYPYFLPCAIAATLTFFIWLVVYFFLPETLEYRISVVEYFKPRKGKRCEDLYESDGLHWTIPESDRPVPVRQLLTNRKVVIAAASYAVFCLLDIIFQVIQPVFYSTPEAFGGLGLRSSSIGNILSLLGIVGGILQGIFFPRIHGFLGSKRTFIIGLASFFPLWICFPLMSLLVKKHGFVSAPVWGLVVIQNLSGLIRNLGFGASFVFVAASSPNNASLGATNGMNQMAVSIMRAIGPASATFLFSWSLEKQYMNGFLVYYCQIVLVFVALWVASHLPHKPWSR